MYATWWKLGLDTTLLAFEAQSVIALRMAKLAAGGSGAQVEAQRMVSEKLLAASDGRLARRGRGRLPPQGAREPPPSFPRCGTRLTAP
jgi:hypothetical protein